jgi:HEAT repeat protein
VTGGGVLAAASVSAVLGALVSVVIVARDRARRAREARAEAEVRPILFGILDEGDFNPRTVDALKPAQQRALEAQARSLLPKLRGQDREVLAKLLDRRGAVDAARRQSRSKRAAARAQAGEFLGDAGSPTAVRDLLELLHDPNPQVRWSAARGLGRLGNPAALSPLLASLEGARPMPVDVVAEAIFEIRDCPVSVLRQGLKSQSVPTRALTVELLGRFQALTAADDVIDRLHHDPSVEVRARAARALGRMGTPRALDPLLCCLSEGPVAMRVQAIWALGEIGAFQAVPALRGILLEPSRQMAELAALALVAIGPHGVKALAEIAEGVGAPALIAAQALASRADLEPSLP